MKKIWFLFLLLILTINLNVYATDCARVTGPFADQDVLYAADYESEMNNLVSCVNERIQGTNNTFSSTVTASGGDIKIQSGYNLKLYSDSGSTLYGDWDGATGKFVGAVETYGHISNCSIGNSGTTLTIKGNTSSLSATNPCFVSVESSTAGQIAIAKFTSDITVTHGASSDSDGNLFGISNSDWASTMPMFYGVVNSGSDSYFVLYRDPTARVTGSAATDLCQKNDTDCDAEDDVMILATGLTLASWVNKPITPLGWINATYASATSAWTFAVSTGNGFNKNYIGPLFAQPTGQMGAVASYHYNNASGANNPTYATPANITFYYQFKLDNNIKIYYNTSLAGNVTNGSVGNDLALKIPYKPAISGYAAAGRARVNSVNSVAAVLLTAGTTEVTIEGYPTTGGIAANSLANSGDDLYLIFEYKI